MFFLEVREICSGIYGSNQLASGTGMAYKGCVFRRLRKV